MLDLELPSLDFDMDIGGGLDLPSLDLGIDVAGGDVGPALDIGPVAADLSGGNALEASMDTPLGISYDVTGELDPQLVNTINAIGSLVLAEAIAEPLPGLGHQTLAPAPVAFEAALPISNAAIIPELSELLPIPSEADISSVFETPADIEILAEANLPEVLAMPLTEPAVPGELETDGQLSFSSLLADSNMSSQDTAVSVSYGMEGDESFIDTTRYAMTADGQALIHNERVFPQTGAFSEAVATDTSVESYLEKSRPLKEETPVLNVGWNQEQGDYALTWREGQANHAFPPDVEINLRGQFSGPTWKAAPQPDYPIRVADGLTTEPQPADHQILEGVNVAIGTLRPYIQKPIITTIPD